MAGMGRVRATALLAATGAVVAMAPLAQATAASASSTQYAFGADAYGTQVSGNITGITVSSGRSSEAYLGCTVRPQTQTNSTAGVTLTPLNSNVGAITTKVTSTDTSGTYSDTANTQIASTSLLGGAITSGVITVNAAASEGGSAPTATATMSAASLSIGGNSISANPGPNTTVNVPNLGKVVINSQKIIRTSGRALANDDAIVVTLATGNTLGLPAGLVITVGHTLATLGGPVGGLVSGESYGTSISNDPVLTSGPSFPAFVNCTGNGGQTVTSRGNSVAAGALLSAGAVTDTATSTDNASTVSAGTSAQVASASVNPAATIPLLSLSAIKSTATASVDSSGNLSDSGTTTIGVLKVLGVQITLPATIPPNYSVPLVGSLKGDTLVLNRQTVGVHGLSVQGLYLNLGSVGSIVIASSGAYA